MCNHFKYVGIGAMRRMIDFGISEDLQEAIIQCLQANDESLQRKVQFLYKYSINQGNPRLFVSCTK